MKTKTKTIDEARIGDRVEASDGFATRIGTVYGRQSGEFGKWLRIKMEDYTFDTCHGFTDRGIGWRHIGR